MNTQLIPIRSTWPSFARGKPLTNARIAFYEREGRYGVEHKTRALAAQSKTNATGPCECGCKINVRFCRWFNYLPHAGNYCPRCLDKYRKIAEDARVERRLAREQNAKLLELY